MMLIVVRTPNSVALPKLEQQAREQKIGLWSQPNPFPPWEFRKNEKEQSDGVQARREQEQPTVRQSQLISQNVQIAVSGKECHLRGCQTLGSGATPISRSDAERKGYEPCNICKRQGTTGDWADRSQKALGNYQRGCSLCEGVRTRHSIPIEDKFEG